MYSEPGCEAIISGWGAITNDTVRPDFPDVLQTVTVPIVPLDECNETIEKVASDEGEVIKDIVHETNVCTGPLTGGVSGCSVSTHNFWRTCELVLQCINENNLYNYRVILVALL